MDNRERALGESIRQRILELPEQRIGSSNSTWDDCEPLIYLLKRDVLAALTEGEARAAIEGESRITAEMCRDAYTKRAKGGWQAIADLLNAERVLEATPRDPADCWCINLKKQVGALDDGPAKSTRYRCTDCGEFHVVAPYEVKVGRAGIEGTFERATAPLPTAREMGWLIERRDRSAIEWLVCDSAGYEWTSDPLKPIRFCRREDADQIASVFDDIDVHITEHQWGL